MRLTKIIEASVMGIIQGVAEFLPISSSGHLVILEHLFKYPKADFFFIVLLHIATLLAISFVLYREIAEFFLGGVYLLGDIFSPLKQKFSKATNYYISKKLFILTIIATVFTGIIGIILKKIGIEEIKPGLVGIFLIINGCILLLTKVLEKGNKGWDDLSFLDAVIIGVAQGIGVIPGISRSGITISTGLFRGISREVAGRFSFIIAFPAIIGSLLVESIEASKGLSQNFIYYIIGFLWAFITGMIALKFLLKIIKEGKLHWFGLYCFILGIIVFLFL